jgi:uncharacterized protein (DUF736 family)
MSLIMSLVGTFVPTSDGFTGRIKTLLLDEDLTLSVLRESVGGNPPDFLITLEKQGDGPFVGAARKRRTEKGTDFISVRIDDPSFNSPIFAVLFPSETSPTLYNLYWTRLNRPDDKP